MFLTTVGLAVGMVAGFALGAPTVAIVGMMLVVTVIGAILGGVSGAVQSFGLPPSLGRRGSWILATGVGMAIGLTAGTVRGEQLGLQKGNPIHEALFIALIGLVTGAFAGLAQFWVLRGRVSRPGLWVPASALASGVGFLLGGLAAVAFVGGFRSVAGLAIVGVTGGILSGAFGGLVLGRISASRVSA
jgi:hypothetical protein